MSTQCPELVAQLKNINKAKNNLEMMIDVFSTFKYNPSSIAEMKTRHMLDIYKIRKNLRELIEQTDFEIYDTSEEVLNFQGLVRWLRHAKASDGKSLESKLEGGSFEKHIKFQEEFYQKAYGPDFKLDLDSIEVDKTRLTAIRNGLDNGYANYPLVMALPESLDEEGKQLNEAQFAFQRLCSAKMPELWALDSFLCHDKSSSGFLGGCNDVDLQALHRGDWSSEMTKVLVDKVPARPNKNVLKIIFTDSRSQIPKEQNAVNIFGWERKMNDRHIFETITQEIQALTIQEWLILASQLFDKDGTILSKDQNNWLASVCRDNWKTDRDGTIRKGPSATMWVDIEQPFLYLGYNNGAYNINRAESRHRLENARWRSAL